MEFVVQQSSGKEVIYSSIPLEKQSVAEGELGRWRIDMVDFEKYLTNKIKDLDFGQSIETYCFGFEIADTKLWGEFFASTKEYISYRPKSKTLVSVGQIEWLSVKDLDFKSQLKRLAEAIVESATRVSVLKRKPKDFNYEYFAEVVKKLVLKYSSKNA
ncbi:hypothetical protein [Bowmanella sp. JS7-9]|uniref:Uncharacterized protein n=1 Tax=Pseudobowmanella zhangzhouensis TaxID=1537679 RepID=A0ABW1XL82_9ALTE|nr:hypothetical protein [Bowmanella sp. JS7-9]TBX25800.1 hypothetical protein TK45_03730 [Bowmanella sp. JS7-9]